MTVPELTRANKVGIKAVILYVMQREERDETRVSNVFVRQQGLESSIPGSALLLIASPALVDKVTRRLRAVKG